LNAQKKQPDRGAIEQNPTHLAAFKSTPPSSAEFAVLQFSSM
jgi:hypothetical protein